MRMQPAAHDACHSSMPFVNPRTRTWIWSQRAARLRQGDQPGGQARSGLLPQVFVGVRRLEWPRAGYVRHRRNSRAAATVIAGFRQVLYSDDAWTAYTVQQKTQLSREEEWNQLRLDIARTRPSPI